MPLSEFLYFGHEDNCVARATSFGGKTGCGQSGGGKGANTGVIRKLTRGKGHSPFHSQC